MSETAHSAESVAPWTDQDLHGTITSEVEYGLMLDCPKEGCWPYHADNGHVRFWRPGKHNLTPSALWDAKVNGHAATVVRRTITYSPWEAVPLDGSTHIDGEVSQ